MPQVVEIRVPADNVTPGQILEDPDISVSVNARQQQQKAFLLLEKTPWQDIGDGETRSIDGDCRDGTRVGRPQVQLRRSKRKKRIANGEIVGARRGFAETATNLKYVSAWRAGCRFEYFILPEATLGKAEVELLPLGR
jgi:hypothetical protein